MAANRLIAVLIVVMVMSTVAAALAPPPPQRGETDTAATTAAPEPERDRTRGKLIRISLSSEPDEPVRTRVRVGDQIDLTVRSSVPGYVSVPRLAKLEFALPGDPAEFDFVADEHGPYRVLFGDPAELIGTIVVGARRNAAGDGG